MGKRTGLLLLLVTLAFGGSFRTFATTPDTNPPPGPSACDAALNPNATSPTLDSFNARFEVHSIRELVDTDPAKNLAVKHPTIVMDVPQLYEMAKRKFQTRMVADPTYPIKKYPLYPIYSDGVAETDGRLVVGQLEALSDVEDFISARANGKSSGDALMVVGPPSTGKTELLIVRDISLDRLSLSDPNFFEYTYRFKNLDKVPYLKPLVADETGNLHIKLLKRSPLVLLPPEMQKRVVAMATERVNSLIEFDPSPFTTPDPQCSEILTALVDHYRKEHKLTAFTEADYMNMLDQYVDVVRRVPDPNAPPSIVRFQGKHPEPSQLFFSENIYLAQIYGKNSALAYDYNGVIPRHDGRGVFLDELYRNDEGLLNTLLDFVQNGVVESGGAPPLVLNTLVLASTNDENVEETRKKGTSNASLDRVKKLPMRQPIHPLLAAEIALVMQAPQSLPRKFQMRPLDSDKMEPAKLTTLFTIPNEKGEIKGPDGRYAIYYTPISSKKILIAPHSLEMIGMIAAGTRMVTDPALLKPFLAELNVIGPNSHQFTSIKNRLDIITRRVQAESPVLADLARLQKLLREGQGGISARDAKRWLEKALLIAEKSNSSVTPMVVDKAFREMIDNGEFFDNKSELRANWLKVSAIVKADFTLPDLSADVQAIVGGEGGMVDKIYDEIVREVKALASNDKESYWYNDAGEKRPIDKSRLSAIYALYEKMNGEPFTPGRVKTWEIANGGEVFQPLMRVVRSWLLEKEMSTKAYDEMLDYFDGKSVSVQTQERGREAEASLLKAGYDKPSFVQALRFVRDLQYEVNRQRGVSP